MNLKPFDLEAAKAGKPIVCQDGTPAKFIAYVPDGFTDEKLAILRNGKIVGHAENGGIFYNSSGYSSDLFMAPEKRKVWVNIIENTVTLDREMNGPWPLKEDAAIFNIKPWKRIACIEVEFTEGQGLEESK